MRPFLRRTLAAACLAAAPATAQENATVLSGSWQGTYTCLQGATWLRLDLRGNEHGVVSGVFRFDPLPLAPEVPSGQYPVLGRKVGASLVLRPVDAGELDQGYKPVGLQGIVNEAGDVLWGEVDGAACDGFGADKVAGAAPADPLTGGYGAQIWEPVLEQGSQTFYADGRDLGPSENSVRILWMRVRFTADSEQGSANAARDYQMEYNCGERTSRILSWVEYDPEGRIERFDLMPSLRWDSVGEAGQPNALGYERACATQLG